MTAPHQLNPALLVSESSQCAQLSPSIMSTRSVKQLPPRDLPAPTPLRSPGARLVMGGMGMGMVPSWATSSSSAAGLIGSGTGESLLTDAFSSAEALAAAEEDGRSTRAFAEEINSIVRRHHYSSASGASTPLSYMADRSGAASASSVSLPRDGTAASPAAAESGDVSPRKLLSTIPMSAGGVSGLLALMGDGAVAAADGSVSLTGPLTPSVDQAAAARFMRRCTAPKHLLASTTSPSASGYAMFPPSPSVAACAPISTANVVGLVPSPPEGDLLDI